MTRQPTYTVVSFHAHPDDEALLSAGSLAKAAAEGHRVVLVVATSGEAGLVSTEFLSGHRLADQRVAELRQSARSIGVARVENLGYADSGMDGNASGGTTSFALADVDEAARRLAVLLQEERADVLTVYDQAGGYGHPDHVQVHRVGVRAAELAGTRVVLEATIDRDLLVRAVGLLRRFRRLLPGLDLPDFAESYTPRGSLTHRIDVRRHVAAKRAAMAAHASQSTSDSGDRTLAFFLRLPSPVFRLAFGREWYVERGRRPGRVLLTDMFATLAEGGADHG
jgi:LmbE family N-acetylglucosaminyl deacetylase